MANLRETLSETTQIGSTDKIIVESDIDGTQIAEFQNIIFEKTNFDFDYVLNGVLTGAPALSAEIAATTLTRLSTVETPEILALFYDTNTTGSSDTIGYAGSTSTIIKLSSVHVNTINFDGEVDSSEELSPNACGEGYKASGGVLLSTGIYRVECNATFTLIGAPGGYDYFNNAYGNGAKAYIVMELFQNTPPHKVLLLGSPGIDYALKNNDVDMMNTYYNRSSTLAKPSVHCFMYGYIMICKPSEVVLKVNTAGTYIVGFPQPKPPINSNLPPAISTPIQLIIEKISNNINDFDIALPSNASLPQVVGDQRTSQTIFYFTGFLYGPLSESDIGYSSLATRSTWVSSAVVSVSDIQQGYSDYELESGETSQSEVFTLVEFDAGSLQGYTDRFISAGADVPTVGDSLKYKNISNQSTAPIVLTTGQSYTNYKEGDQEPNYKLNTLDAGWYGIVKDAGANEFIVFVHVDSEGTVLDTTSPNELPQ